MYEELDILAVKFFILSIVKIVKVVTYRKFVRENDRMLGLAYVYIMNNTVFVMVLILAPIQSVAMELQYIQLHCIASNSMEFVA